MRGVRVPLLSGTQLLVVDGPDDAVVLIPPEPARQAITDVGAAVRDAVRFPLSGPPLAGIVPRGGRATIVTDVPALPLPSAPVDARRAAIGAAVQELRNLGIPDERQTILVTAGLGRSRAAASSTGSSRRRSRGRSTAGCSCTTPKTRRWSTFGRHEGRHLAGRARARRHGCRRMRERGRDRRPRRAGVLLACGSADAQRDATALSLLEPSGSDGWRSALSVEAGLARRAPLLGVSLALDQPRIAETAFGYPYDPRAAERIAASRTAKLFRWLPGAVRLRVIRALPVSITAAGAFAGLPSVAHAEALLRSIELRSIELDRPLDAICLGIPRTTPYLPRERPNPLLAAYLGLGHALRLWRRSRLSPTAARRSCSTGFTAASPIRRSCRTARSSRRRARGSIPSSSTRRSERPRRTSGRSTAIARDGRAIRCSRTPTGQAIRRQTERLGTVIVGGCRDAAGARHLGFVPGAERRRGAVARARQWRKAKPASASCWRRRTRRSASARDC